MKYLAVLGSTGSIGQSALRVVSNFPGEFRVLALSVNSNIDILFRQIKIFRPAIVCVKDPLAASRLKNKLRGTRVLTGEEGLEEIVSDKRLDEVLLAISGSDALWPLLKAIENGKDISLANKEALVVAGDILMRKAAEKKVRIKPIDSEQSAIWQCLNGQGTDKLKGIYLTASGGPFLGTKKGMLKNVLPKEVLRHPRWKMGKKITVDSATLMNKGLEVIEAMHLFGVSWKKIKVIIHPESIIHSMVEFIDGVIMAQLSVADMRIPIQYALLYPKRMNSAAGTVDFFSLKSLNFERPDYARFPCLKLAYQAASEGGTSPAVLNAANEVSVNAFLKREIDFVSIPRMIEKVLQRHDNKSNPSLKDILKAQDWARHEAEELIERKR